MNKLSWDAHLAGNHSAAAAYLALQGYMAVQEHERVLGILEERIGGDTLDTLAHHLAELDFQAEALAIQRRAVARKLFAGRPPADLLEYLEELGGELPRWATEAEYVTGQGRNSYLDEVAPLPDLDVLAAALEKGLPPLAPDATMESILAPLRVEAAVVEIGK